MATSSPTRHSGNPTVRDYRGALGTVRHGETVTPSRNRKSGNGNPSPTARRARFLSRPRGAKGAGHRRLRPSQLATGRAPYFNGKRQPSIGGTSRISREAYVRICERLGVKIPGAASKAADLGGERPLPSIARFRTASISDARGDNEPRSART